MATKTASIKLSQADVEGSALAKKPHLQKYATRLQAMDKSGNGEVDLAEVCELLDEVANLEKEKKMLKWMAIISGIFALLSIAAIVGLTYAVVDMSKDTKMSGGSTVMVSKDSGAPISTGKTVTSTGLHHLYKWPLKTLKALDTIVVSDDKGINILHVSKVYVVPNTSVTVATADGTEYFINADGVIPVGGVDSANVTNGARRLLGVDQDTAIAHTAVEEEPVDPLATPSLESCSPSSCPEGQQYVSNGETVTTNGCGSDVFNAPEYLLANGLTDCCNNHDICYGTCFETKKRCDDAFYSCMQNSCSTNYAANTVSRSMCDVQADDMYAVVVNFSCTYFQMAQIQFCTCQ